MTTEQPRSLEELRAIIDQIDAKLVGLIADRARIVQEVGAAKRSTGVSVYVPHREREVIERAVSRNTGPLSSRTIEAVFREIMSGSFVLETPPRIGYLGPAGSFSHLAAIRHFGSSVELLDLHDIEHVFEEVAAGRVDHGLVPYENSIGGSVTETLDAFQTHAVHVCAEALVGVSQALMANCAPNEVRLIASKAEALSQCRHWLSRHFPDVEQVPVASTSTAVQDAARTPGTAAVGSALAGELYGVRILFERIEDKPGNVTRFLVLSRASAKPSGNDKTTVMFTTAHRPGALVDVLAAFRDASINLSHIEKRPSRRENWQYLFFIDCDAHEDDASMKRALAEARSHCVELRVLGSYPRAERVL
ncbi:MAG: prephenate dehydratase [Phycisphaerales bacterium]